MMSVEFDKVAIANRGEVAVRIIKACNELGIKTVLLHSEADKESIAYRLADETVCIGESSVQESYLDIDKNINAALSVEADAIHPGFGFLSENADFAKACEANRIKFIGPSAECIQLFGDKISAKSLVEKAGGPTIPGYQGKDQSVEVLTTEADKIGYPVIVKAAAGGGGRGLRVVHNKKDMVAAIEAAKREGLSAFGSDKVFLEKYLDKAKHIEVQIFGDVSGKAFHLMERECSVQRRHQKVVEEALSTLDGTLRNKLCKTAVEIAEQAKYIGAGTVEFLVQEGEYYFLEMNTRLQVEHPVTELVMGVDLVKAQIMAAQGHAMIWEQAELIPRGHAIECRLYAEDPFMNGMPSVGVLGECYWPHGPGRRFEVGFEAGDEITMNYDPMIAKIIVWDETRFRAIQKMKQTLSETVIFGVKTNIPYLQEILSHHEFVDGTMTTKFIEKNFPEGLKPVPLTESEELVAKMVFDKIKDSQLGAMAVEGESTHVTPWSHEWRSK